MNMSTIAKQVNDVGAETPPKGAPNPSSTPRPIKDKNLWKLSHWLFGFFFSLLPIISGPITGLILKESVQSIRLSLLTDVSIMYVGVSLLVSAMNDLEQAEHARIKFYTVILAVVIMSYTIISVITRLVDSSALNTKIIIFLNISFLVFPFFCGLQQYLRSTRRGN